MNIKKYHKIIKKFKEFHEYDTLVKRILENDDKKRDIYNKIFETYEKGIRLGLSYAEIYDIWYKIKTTYKKSNYDYRKTPQKEGRDNKGVYVGSGGSNCNKVRYPSKKRSVRVWKKFYAMFPYYAEKDNFDGKTSDKMK